ncbi:MAG TPA: type II and III secretion system protein family protein, partial [Novosphingobium sp.]|nr:type II and III secretion system protein family protein [Novosphingobium sp.]
MIRRLPRIACAHRLLACTIAAIGLLPTTALAQEEGAGVLLARNAPAHRPGAHQPARRPLAHRPAPHAGVRLVAGRTAPLGAASITRPASEILLSIGRGQLVNLGGTVSDVFIADDKIADVQVKSNRQLYIFGKGAGETTIYASAPGGQIVWSSTLRVGSNIDSVDQMLKVAMPDARITVSTMSSNTVLLTGTINAPEDSAEAQRLVQAYMGSGTNVISRLHTATPLQVNLQVRIAEVSRKLTRALGVNLQTVSSSNGFAFLTGRSGLYSTGTSSTSSSSSSSTSSASASSGGTSVTLNGLASSNTLGYLTSFGGMTLLSALDAAETVGLVTTLAQPNLTALSGETADFLAGGQYPIPISSGLGTTSIEYKNYGVSLSYTPTVLADGRISLRVRPEVSQLDTSNAVTMNGTSVPALTIRRAETTVELGSGQSFMIAGLLSNSATNSISKIPGAGDVPVLGALFKSTSFARGDTELVIVVTPYLVKPVNDGDIKLPTDGMQSPDDIQRVFGNMLADRPKDPKDAKRPGATAAESTGKPAIAAPAQTPPAQSSAPPAARTGDAAPAT